MLREFKRYRLENFRILTGILELLGGVGTLVGYFYRIPFLVSTAGLGLLMFLGLVIRIRVKDSWQEMLPALILMLINFYLFANRIITD